MPRKLSTADAPALHAIEALATDYPWSQRQYLDSFAIGDFGWGIEHDGQLVGFAIFSHVIDEATLLNLVVAPQWQRHGFARQLLLHGLNELAQRAATRCLLEVRVGNTGAIALYAALGFEVDGKRRDYYPAANGREDALLMSRTLPYQEIA